MTPNLQFDPESIFRLNHKRVNLKPFLEAHEKCKENYLADGKLITMENALKSVGYEKPDEYFYRALQYVDGMECVNGTPYDKVSTGDLTEDDLQTEQGEESFKNRKIM